MRWQAAELAAIDHWRRRQAESPTRPEAIRRLVEVGLASAQPAQPPSRNSTAKSSALAGKQIDLLHDEAATPEQRASRKRRLIKGPKEFRDMRGPKAKGPSER